MKLYDHDIKRLEEICEYIFDSMADEITVTSLSSLFGISTTTLKRHFRIQFDKGVHQFITDIRMNKAVWLLVTENKTINEVALSVGYKDANSFGRAFKLHFGVTPLELRNGKKSSNGPFG